MRAERAKAAGEIRSGSNLQWEQLKAGAICGASDWQLEQFTSSDRQREHLQGAMGRKSNCSKSKTARAEAVKIHSSHTYAATLRIVQLHSCHLNERYSIGPVTGKKRPQFWAGERNDFHVAFSAKA